MRRLQTSVTWLLVLWACVLPMLAAAHDHEHDYEDHGGEPVLCCCAAISDREDDALLASELAVLPLAALWVPVRRDWGSEPAELACSGDSAIRAPPSTV